MDPDILFRIVDITGVFANGLIGATLARNLGFDVIGYLALGIATALGGGMVRDMMLDLGPPVALTDPWYLAMAILASLISLLIPLEGRYSRTMLNALDALALGCWSATGASKGLAAGLGVVPSIFLGVITATLGGVIRDVLVQRRPAIFGSNPLYATLSIAAAGIMVLFQSNGLYEVGMGSAIVLTFVFTLLARKYQWTLPTRGLDLRIKRDQVEKSRERLKNSRANTRPLRQRAREGRHRRRHPDDDSEQGAGRSKP